MEISIVLGLSCIFLIMSNVLVFRLALWQSKQLAEISDGLGDLVDIITSYRDHLKDVYSLDSFYGDETLQGLMTHTNAVRQLLEEQYGDVISITDPIEYDENNEVEENAEEESTEKEKHVLYAGTRRRDS